TVVPTSLLCHCPFPCSFPEARVDTSSRTAKATRERVVLKFQATLAGSIGQSLHAAMEQVCTTVKDDLGDARILGAFGDELAYSSCSGRISTRLQRALEILFKRGGCCNRMPLNIIDELGIDVL